QVASVHLRLLGLHLRISRPKKTQQCPCRILHPSLGQGDEVRIDESFRLDAATPRYQWNAPSGESSVVRANWNRSSATSSPSCSAGLRVQNRFWSGCTIKTVGSPCSTS